MSIAVTVNTAEPVVKSMRDGLTREAVLPYLAEAGTQTVQENLMGLEQSHPNKLGGERRHYYADAADNTEWHQDGNHAVISVHAPGIVTRYFGGTIRAGAGTIMAGPNAGQPTKYLTIPVTAEAYGKRASDIPGLVVLWGRNGPYAIGRKFQGSIMTQGAGQSTTENHEPLFILKREVNIPPDPSLLPSDLRMMADLRIAFADYVTLLKEQAMERAQP